MFKKRNEYDQVITPKGVVAWASIDEADFDYKDEGEFHIRLRFDPEDPEQDLSAIREMAEELLEEAHEAKKRELTKAKKGALLKKLHKVEDVIKEEVDSETGEATGKLIIRAGMRHRITPKTGKYAGKTFEKFPDVFDARGKKLKKRPRIGSGSVVKASISPMDYFSPKGGELGIRFELSAVQIIRLVQGGSRDAASYGFGQEDGDAIEDEDTGGFADEGEGYEGGDDGDDADF